MGNNQSHEQDVLMASLANKRELDISKKLSHSSYVRHTQGEDIEGCLTDLPWEIVDEVSLYERVNVSFNLITTLPVELPLRLPHLQHLNLSHNRIKELPESIALFFHLEELNVSFNLLSALPRNITNMRKLCVLDISHNQFQRLPDDIGDIPGLQKLNASHNQLSLLPTSLGTSPSLDVLLVDGNKFLSTIYEAGSDNVLAQLREAAPAPSVAPPVSAQAVFTRQNAPARGQFAQLQAQKVETGRRTRTPLLPPSGASRLEPERLRDAVVGLLYGGALGDALGLATDGLSGDQCRFHYSAEYTLADTVRDERRVRYRDGDWTSNTDLMLVALDSLLHWGGVLDELDLAQRLHSWRERGLPEVADARRPAADLHVVRAIDTDGFTESPHAAARRAAGVASSANNNLSPARPGTSAAAADDGCLPMAVICGIPRFHDLSEVAGNAQRVCLTTHAAPVCVAACVALAALVAQLLQGAAHSADQLEEALRTAASLAGEFTAGEEERKALEQSLLDTESGSVDPSEGGVLATLSVAVAALRLGCRREERSSAAGPLDWRRLVTLVTLQGGRASVRGTLCGALLGARSSLAGLPATLLAQLRPGHTEYLSGKLNSLLDLMAL
ncbi:uncharacterized protein LOC122387559 [Amphibalanus amphitrite]|uniref:uncharacterized protein LOC122387559 n=1 Tax=Amphibalanus amphitrite TaxID=1232801 RepID=UPI001C92A925|nr:uncharacterized protein LOC122387559 [Amphibalanus amphitrite]